MKIKNNREDNIDLYLTLSHNAAERMLAKL